MDKADVVPKYLEDFDRRFNEILSSTQEKMVYEERESGGVIFGGKDTPTARIDALPDSRIDHIVDSLLTPIKGRADLARHFQGPESKLNEWIEKGRALTSDQAIELVHRLNQKLITEFGSVSKKSETEMSELLKYLEHPRK